MTSAGIGGAPRMGAARGSWVAPLCGVLFVALLVVGFILTGEGQDPADKTAAEVARHYSDNDTSNLVGALLVGLAGIPLLFFAGWLRQVLRAAEGVGGMLSTVSFGALIVVTSGLSVGAALHFALADFADELDPSAISALNAIDYDFFIPLVVGMAAFLLATGISVVRHAPFPTWLGWVAIALGVLSFAGPVGFFAFLAGLVWIVVVGVLGVARGGSRHLA